MRGWQEILPPIESGGIIDNEVQTQEGHLLLQLDGASPKRAEVVLNARRTVSPEQSLLELPLPTPLVDVISPGKLLVISAPNVAVAPIPEALRGLSLERVPLPAAIQEKWAGYRVQSYLTTLDNASFVAERKVLQQRVQVESEAKVEISETTVNVEQLLRFQVDFEPVQRIALRVPAELQEKIGNRNFILLDDQTNEGDDRREKIEVLPTSTLDLAEPASKEKSIVLLLPRPLIGRFTVQLGLSVG